MKTAVLYQSRGGNTRAVAEVIASSSGTIAKPYTEGLNEPVDRLFLGGGAYMVDADAGLKDFINSQLDASKVKELVAFSTAGGQKAALTKIVELAKARGIKVNENTLLIRMLLKGHTMLGLKGGKLSNRQVETIKAFVAKL